MREESQSMISTSSALTEKNALRAKLQADMDAFVAAGGEVRDASGSVVNQRFEELSKNKRKMKNNSDVFAWREDMKEQAARRHILKKIVEEK